MSFYGPSNIFGGNGGGVNIEGTPSTGQITTWYSSDTITGSNNIIFIDDNFQVLGEAIKVENEDGTAFFKIVNGSSILSDEVLGRIQYSGIDEASNNISAEILATATEDWDDSSHGTKLEMSTTPNGSISPVTIIKIGQDGSFAINDTDFYVNKVTGGVGFGIATTSDGVVIQEKTLTMMEVNNYNELLMYRSNDTKGVAPLANADVAGQLSFGGWDSAQFTKGVFIKAVATEDWSFVGPDRGMNLEFWTTENGTGTPVQVFIIGPGFVSINAALVEQGELSSNLINSASLKNGNIVSDTASGAVFQTVVDPTTNIDTKAIYGQLSLVQTKLGNTYNIASSSLIGTRSVAEHLGSGNLSSLYGSWSQAESAYGNTDSLFGAGANAALAGSSSSDLMMGIAGSSWVYGTATVTDLVGIGTNSLTWDTPTVANAYGIRILGVTNYGGTITNEVGILAKTGGSATNNIDLMLGTSSIPTGNYAIYSDSAYTSYFNGNIGLGTIIPDEKLEVNGHIRHQDDDEYHYWGESKDCGITYDGTNMVFDSQLVGSGDFKFDNGNMFIVVKSGATQSGAGAAANEVWKTSSHATLPDNVLMIGV